MVEGAEGVEQPVTVKVAMLQMNAVGVAVGADPVPAHLERATMFVKEAKRRGADIVLFPEQWSVSMHPVGPHTSAHRTGQIKSLPWAGTKVCTDGVDRN